MNSNHKPPNLLLGALLLLFALSPLLGQGGGRENTNTTKPPPKRITPAKKSTKTTPSTAPTNRSTTNSNTSTGISLSSAAEMAFWDSIKNSSDPEDFKAYLEKYPNGSFVALARNRLRNLEATKASPSVTPASDPTPIKEANLLRCDNVLLQPNVSVLQSDSRRAGAWLTLVNENNYEQAKTNVDARYKVIFGANYSQFNERRREYLSIQKSSYSVSDARSEMQIALSQFQVEAWADCIEATTSNNVLTLAAIEPTNDSAMVIIQWRPSGGAGNISSVTADLQGAAPGSQLLNIGTILPGARGFIVRRAVPGGSIRGVISGVLGNPAHPIHVNVLVPELSPSQPFVLVNRSEAGRAARSGSLAQLLDAIVRGWNVNADVDDERNIMLHVAAEDCSEGKVRALIDAGSANRPNKWNDTPHNIAKARCGASHPVTILTGSL